MTGDPIRTRVEAWLHRNNLTDDPLAWAIALMFIVGPWLAGRCL